MTQTTGNEAFDRDMIYRLVALVPLLRMATLAGWSLGLGALLAILSAVLSPDLWWLVGFLGAAIGYAIGSVFAAYFALTIEWMVRSPRT